MTGNGSLPFRFPDAPDLHVWNNAAFDDAGLDEPTASSLGWAHSSLDSKENLSPVLENNSNSPRANNNGAVLSLKKEEDEEKIDREIEEIEREVARLSSRLHALKLEKAERKIKKTVERRNSRIVPAKFMDPTRRRGLSLGPAEIFSGSKPRLLKETGILTPATSSKQSRRVSCFWRIQEVDELKVIKERGKSASLSPKERKQPGAKPKQGAATTGLAKKPVKKENGLIQPRTLFKDGERERERQGKKVVKPGRVVASRYNSSGQGEARKRSLPDNDKDEGNKRRVSRGGQPQQQRRSDNEGGRVKKRWDVAAPSVEDVLPKIRTQRCVAETPRDSGPAKRVADLVGRRSFFGDDLSGKAEDSVCQVLRFGEVGGLDD